MTGSRTANTAGAANIDLQDCCLHQWIEHQAEARPDAIAVKCGDDSLDYATLNQLANQLAAKLLEQGLEPDSPVGLCLERSNNLIVGILGILKAGGAYVPLDPNYPPDRLAHILDQARPTIIVSSDAVKNILPASAAALVNIDRLSATETANPTIDLAADQLCYIIFTSGTTGLPKGVMVSHRNVARLFTTLANDLEFTHDDVWTLFHSYAFGFSAWEIFGALLNGGTLIIVPDELRTNPSGLYDLLRREQVSVFSQTPSAFRQLLLSDKFEHSDDELAFRMIVFSGEAVVARDLQQWFDQHPNSPRLINTYAITETGQGTFCRRSRRQHRPTTGGHTNTHSE
jgi:non-ribosomal peptide synthetase component F